MQISIIDYGLSNLASIERATKICARDAQVAVVDNPNDLDSADAIILPGVGAFADAMTNLKTGGFIPKIKTAVADGVPFLGICLGMQLLASESEEGGLHPGLDLIPGKVLRLQPQKKEKVPHVGWNSITWTGTTPLSHQINSGTDFYFVHSYYLAPKNPKLIMAECDFAGGFCAVVQKDNVFGAQFHPEKSSTAGFTFLSNFIAQI